MQKKYVCRIKIVRTNPYDPAPPSPWYCIGGEIYEDKVALIYERIVYEDEIDEALKDIMELYGKVRILYKIIQEI